MSQINIPALKAFLDKQLVLYHKPCFIEQDPISIPHSYRQQQDIEIAGFFAAMLAWGQRKVSIYKAKQLLHMMDNAPYDFVRHHQVADLKQVINFKHRTFDSVDILYFIRFLQHHYQQYDTLEVAFLSGIKPEVLNIESGLIGFYQCFFSLPNAPARTHKHIATPANNSACKRLNMFLRWMVRQDKQGIDFGLWKAIKPYQLVCPCDVHVSRVARALGLIKRKKTDWQAALELTHYLKKISSDDPIQYDFAFFGLGVTGFEL